MSTDPARPVCGLSDAEEGGGDPAVDPSPEPELAPAVSACLNCEAALVGRYCAACGQDHRHARLGTRTMLEDAFDALTDLEGKFWTTFRGLLRNPGKLARDYVDGHRRRHTHPFRYLLVAITFYVLLLWLAGLKPSDLGKEFQGTPPPGPAGAFQQSYADWSDRNFSVMFLTIIPMLALGLRVVFRKSGLNFAECLVLPAYAHAQSIFVITPFFLALQQYLGASALWGMTASILYQTWAVWGFFRTSWWKALLAYLAAFAAWLVALMIVVTFVVVGLIVAGSLQF